MTRSVRLAARTAVLAVFALFSGSASAQLSGGGASKPGAVENQSQRPGGVERAPESAPPARSLTVPKASPSAPDAARPAPPASAAPKKSDDKAEKKK